MGNVSGRNLRFTFALSTASYAVGYLILIVFKRLFSDVKAVLLLIFLFVFMLFLCIKFFFDLKDVKYQDVRKI
jgi:hypothetical protein